MRPSDYLKPWQTFPLQGCTVTPAGIENVLTPAKDNTVIEFQCNIDTEFTFCQFQHLNPMDVGRGGSTSYNDNVRELTMSYNTLLPYSCPGDWLQHSWRRHTAEDLSRWQQNNPDQLPHHVWAQNQQPNTRGYGEVDTDHWRGEGYNCTVQQQGGHLSLYEGISSENIF